ncbi:IPT/TIG domain-containing protein [Streptomyces sp. NPDC058316]|uniref:IPT/TIG domain-containing protein n=1 Tax=unclassified Streptomyces TaxID=2593676 RepID=UPI003332916D
MPVSPNQGSTAGGTAVTITGTNLTETTAVHFGDASATGVTNVSPTRVTAIAPAATGVVEVTVTTPGGNSNPASFFYIDPPLITTVSPASGQFVGGNTVTITGLSLSATTAVTFGANAGTITGVSNSEITVTVPRADDLGTVPIAVVTAGGTADGLSYTYDANPVATAIDPTSGPISGGNAVTITGSSLSTTEQVVLGPDAVHVGGQTASFTIVSDTEIVAVAPPGVAGAADIVIQSPGGSADMPSAYTYAAGPSI